MMTNKEQKKKTTSDKKKKMKKNMMKKKNKKTKNRRRRRKKEKKQPTMEWIRVDNTASNCGISRSDPNMHYQFLLMLLLQTSAMLTVSCLQVVICQIQEVKCTTAGRQWRLSSSWMSSGL